MAACAAFMAHAQDFPAKQSVKLIVTFAPGGGADTIARTLNSKMARPWWSKLGKLSLNHVPYRGAGPAMTDVMGNQVPAVLGTLSGILPHIKSGGLKAIAVTSKQRSPLIPEVATIAESVGQIIGGSAAELDALVAREIRQLTEVVREQGLKPE